MLYPFTSNTQPNGLYDSHGDSGKTFFGLRLNIDILMPWGFCWSTLDEPRVIIPPVLGMMHVIETTNDSVSRT
jgi:hypothetical protein